MPLPDDVVQQRAGNDLFDGIHHGVFDDSEKNA